MKKIKEKIVSLWKNIPRWFRVFFIILAIVYMSAWSYSAFLATHYGNKFSIPVLHKDATEYALLSDSIIKTHSFSIDGSVPETFRTPGYPAFIALIRTISGGSFLAVTFIQILLALCIALLIQKIGAQHFSPKVGAMAAIIFLINPTTLLVSLVIHSEIPFVTLYILLFWLIGEYLEKKPWSISIISGFLTAMAMYIRPIGFLAFPIFLAPILFTKINWKKKIVLATILVTVTLLLLAPWMLRNKEKTGVFGFSSLATQSIVTYSIPMFRVHLNDTSIEKETNRIVKETGAKQENWRELSSAPLLKPYIYGFVKNNFFSYSKWHAIVSIPFFFASDIDWSRTVYSLAMHKTLSNKSQAAIFDLAKGNVGSFLGKITHPWWKFSERMIFCLFALFSLYVVIKMRRKTAIWVMVGIIVYLAFATGPVATARHRFPVDPFIYLIASAGIVSFVEKRLQKL